MSQIQHKNTKPELIVRQMVTRLGYRYRLHDKLLPGKPDLTFKRIKCVIFVHGCFWHQHNACREGRIPGSRIEYWMPKLTRNVERDQSHLVALSAAGWQVLTIWECELSNPNLAERIKMFLCTGTAAMIDTSNTLLDAPVILKSSKQKARPMAGLSAFAVNGIKRALKVQT